MAPNVVLVSYHLFLRFQQIPVVSDVPGVGNNLQDQIAVPMYFSMEAPLSINEDKVKTLRQIWSYIWGQGKSNCSKFI